MPNYVTNAIEFDAEKAEEVFAAVCPDGKFDFRTLIPQPPSLYRGDVGDEEQEDFPVNWYTWNVENWGTKWNCVHVGCSIDNGKASILFRTAWYIPYPIISAFANKFGISFKHTYSEESQAFWGIEQWGKRESDTPMAAVYRLSKRRNNPEDFGLFWDFDLKELEPEQELPA